MENGMSKARVPASFTRLAHMPLNPMPENSNPLAERSAGADLRPVSKPSWSSFAFDWIAGRKPEGSRRGGKGAVGPSDAADADLGASRAVTLAAGARVVLLAFGPTPGFPGMRRARRSDLYKQLRGVHPARWP